ncbi:hypothetical protein [Natrinema gelatinilyticum]|uniref:hypothetical protein n=1 Tax=Natrinema gelatinilyticum TaxID=2961571 RepID=UPI0020C3512C|nr:hypothetical protein [Natrinema gelatinilyticum]
MTADELDSSPDPSDVETRDAILEQVDLNPPTRLSWCPNCGEAVGSVTSRGLLDHTAGPCGCSLTPGQVKRL